ncbi:hypothetical protein PR048_028723 [Dryococelus australis]|uniref:Uncharacterized protein n=1 Tax=Dryococelus australis TaxID=614101 RepID=A0ABQ9GE59_9NEOP|nr:hypothetical protein PR048_028723 [Dryococelus australis]
MKTIDEDKLRLAVCGAAQERKGGGESPEKTRRPAASSGTIPTYDFPGAIPLGIKPGSPRWETSSLTTTPPRIPTDIENIQIIPQGIHRLVLPRLRLGTDRSVAERQDSGPAVYARTQKHSAKPNTEKFDCATTDSSALVTPRPRYKGEPIGIKDTREGGREREVWWTWRLRAGVSVGAILPERQSPSGDWRGLALRRNKIPPNLRAVTSLDFCGLSGYFNYAFLSGAGRFGRLLTSRCGELMRVKRGEYGAAPECYGGTPPRKPADRCHRPARFPLRIKPGSPRCETSSLVTTPPPSLRAACLKSRRYIPAPKKANKRDINLAVARSPPLSRHEREANKERRLREVSSADSITMGQTPTLVGCAGAAVAGRLAWSPPTKAIRVQSLAGSPDFRVWESCRTMPLAGGPSRGSPVSTTPSFRRRYILTSITLIGSQDRAVKSRPNLFTHLNSNTTQNRFGVASAPIPRGVRGQQRSPEVPFPPGRFKRGNFPSPEAKKGEAAGLGSGNRLGPRGLHIPPGRRGALGKADRGHPLHERGRTEPRIEWAIHKPPRRAVSHKGPASSVANHLTGNMTTHWARYYAPWQHRRSLSRSWLALGTASGYRAPPAGIGCGGEPRLPTLQRELSRPEANQKFRPRSNKFLHADGGNGRYRGKKNPRRTEASSCNDSHERKSGNDHCPGIEPGSPCWEASCLAFTPANYAFSRTNGRQSGINDRYVFIYCAHFCRLLIRDNRKPAAKLATLGCGLPNAYDGKDLALNSRLNLSRRRRSRHIAASLVHSTARNRIEGPMNLRKRVWIFWKAHTTAKREGDGAECKGGRNVNTQRKPRRTTTPGIYPRVQENGARDHQVAKRMEFTPDDIADRQVFSGVSRSPALVFRHCPLLISLHPRRLSKTSITVPRPCHFQFIIWPAPDDPREGKEVGGGGCRKWPAKGGERIEREIEREREHACACVSAKLGSRGLGVVVRLLASRLGEPGSIPGGVARKWELCRTMPLIGGVFSGVSRLPRLFIPQLLNTHLASPSYALRISMLRVAQISALTRSVHKCGALSFWCNFPVMVKLCLHEAEEHPGYRILARLQKSWIYPWMLDCRDHLPIKISLTALSSGQRFSRYSAIGKRKCR